MISRCTDEFWEEYAKLPKNIQQLAIAKFKLWLQNPQNVGFMKISDTVWKAKVGYHYRAFCTVQESEIEAEKIWTWFWIGSHEEYNGMI